jgi:hypothetical protein
LSAEIPLGEGKAIMMFRVEKGSFVVTDVRNIGDFS